MPGVANCGKSRFSKMQKSIRTVMQMDLPSFKDSNDFYLGLSEHTNGVSSESITWEDVTKMIIPSSDPPELQFI